MNLKSKLFLWPTVLVLMLTGMLASHAAAQFKLPEHRSLYLNDPSNVLPEQTAKTLESSIASLSEEYGVEVSVLLVKALKDWGAKSTEIETFARAVFNAWTIGDRTKRDGVLLVISKTDRKIRFQIGGGYPGSASAKASHVIESIVSPALKRDAWVTAIHDGVKALISDIAVAEVTIREVGGRSDAPPVSGVPAAAKSRDAAKVILIVVGVFAAIVVGFILLVVFSTAFRNGKNTLNAPNARRGSFDANGDLFHSTSTDASHGFVAGMLAQQAAMHAMHPHHPSADLSAAPTSMPTSDPSPPSSYSDSGGSFGGGDSGGGATGSF